jgi:hypothetical protein
MIIVPLRQDAIQDTDAVNKFNIKYIQTCELFESEDLLKTIRRCNKICLNKNNNYTALIQNDV